MRKILALLLIGVGLSISPAYALIPNGDFELGNLDGYFAQEDFSDVPSSPLVTTASIASGQTVGQIDTGFTQYGVTTATLGRDFGALPADVQELLFDVRFLDVGEDNDEIFALESSPELLALEAFDPDTLFVTLGSPSNNLPDFFTLGLSGYTNAPGVEVESLSNGFYRVKTNVSSLAGTDNNSLFFDFRDGDDQRLSRVQIDNIDLKTLDNSVVPEPATMFLMGSGLLGFGYLRKKKMV